METTTENLTTAADILEAYLQNFDAYPSQKPGAVRISSEEFHRLFRTIPIQEKATACVGKGQFDLAVGFLDAAYYRNNPGSSEDRQLAKLGLDMAEACLKEKKLNFVEWGLNRAYEIYPEGSPERRQVIEKGISLVDDFAGEGGSLFFAQVILTRSLEIYPEGSVERRQAIEKRTIFAKRMQSARALGSRRNVVRSLAKPPMAKKNLAGLSVAG